MAAAGQACLLRGSSSLPAAPAPAASLLQGPAIPMLHGCSTSARHGAWRPARCVASSAGRPAVVIQGPLLSAALGWRRGVVAARQQGAALCRSAALSIDPSPHQGGLASSAPQQCAAPLDHLRLGRPLGVLLQRSLACVAGVALWSLLCSCVTGGGAAPLASLSIAAGESSTAGIQSAMKSAWTGLAAGVLHTLCGPDHLAALTPLTIGRNRVTASALGALWGFGHSTGQLILGLVMVLLKDRFHDFLPALERWSGVVVACTLIAIGAMGIYESYFEKHGEGDASQHAEEEQEAMKLALAGVGSGGGVRASVKASFATYATGIVYGLQPDALFVVVPALALPSKAAAIAYCSMFVIGTVMAMGGYTLLIGTTSAALTRERPWLQAHLSTVASIAAIVVGVLIGLAGLGFDVPFFG